MNQVDIGHLSELERAATGGIWDSRCALDDTTGKFGPGLEIVTLEWSDNNKSYEEAYHNHKTTSSPFVVMRSPDTVNHSELMKKQYRQDLEFVAAMRNAAPELIQVYKEYLKNGGKR